MPLIIPPGFAQAVFSHTLAGDSEPIVCTVGLDVSDAGGDFETAANTAFTNWADNILPSISNQYQLTVVTLYVGQDGGPPTVVDSTEDSAVGGLSNAALPQNCAYLVRKRTDAAGRRGRGRFYIPGVPEGEVSPIGALSASYRDGMTTSAESFRLAMAGGIPSPSLPLVVLHRSEGIGTEPAPTPITQLVCETIIGTQRRRMRP